MHATMRQARPQRQRHVDARFGQFAVECERIVKQKIAFGADAQGRGKIPEFGGQGTELLGASLRRHLWRIEVPEPPHLRLGEPEPSVSIQPMRREVHLWGIGAVKRHEPRDLAPLLLRQGKDR